MSCEEELNALRRAEQELARFRREHTGAASPGPVRVPGDGSAGSAAPGSPESADIETVQRMAQLTAALREKQDAYNLCLGRVEGVAGVEALMRDASGRPLGGGAGPPM